jgi:ribonuclease D
VVFHDADYDLRLLDQDFGFHARNIFDTRIAAQLLNEPGIGLAALLDKYLGVKLNKKFQRADWSARPLSTEMLAYAATDTRYLPELRDILRGKLQEKGRLVWAEEEFRILEKVRWTPAKRDGTEFLRIKGSKGLPVRTLAILRELYLWRETTAKRRDKAAFRILNNQAMVELAQRPPEHLDALSRTSGVGPETARRHGKSLLAAIERGRLVKDDDLPRIKRPSRPRHDKNYDARLVRLKTARNGVAQRLDLQSGVTCPNGTLESIAREAPATPDELGTIPALRRWQAKEFGEELLAAVASGKQKKENGNQ